ncbi:hypothetical protein [Plantibacter sp. LMC-P-059a]|jgi:hypothetical protein|uniref:hypothetical protein n=1 Tax=Plantibacter sp. LMC-P-059a TaxID=3040297 RepID=UPI00254F1E24|nr:hypothetical protein [Plantibacter sp. LMC-P-059a]
MTGAPTAFPPLVVGSDPVRTERATRPAFVMALVCAGLIPIMGALLAALTASSGGFALGALSALLFGVISWFMLFLALQLATVRGAQSVRRTVMTLDAAGLSGSIQQGEVFLPWGAVERVSIRSRGRWRILTFHLLPGLTVQSPGVTTTLSQSAFARLAKLGFQVGEVAIDTPLDTLLAASGAFTGGRLR